MIRARCPEVCGGIIAALNAENLVDGSALKELWESRGLIQSEGRMDCPSWEALAAGTRPPQRPGAEPGEWAHGWQYFAAAALDSTARDLFKARRPGRHATNVWLGTAVAD